MEKGPPVLEKILLGFLPFMGMAAILVMCPEQTLVAPIQGGSDWLSGFKKEDVWKCEQMKDARAWVYYKLTCEPSAQVS